MISVRRAGIARPLALPMGELARLKAVTERVLSCNLGTFLIFATAYALSGSHSLASSSKGGAKGGCAAGVAGSLCQRVLTRLLNFRNVHKILMTHLYNISMIPGENPCPGGKGDTDYG